MQTLYILSRVAGALLLAFVGITAIPATAAARANVVITNTRDVANLTMWNPCTTEDVEVEADVHTLARSVENGAGGFTVGGKVNWQNVRAFGTISNDAYHGVQTNNFNTSLVPGAAFTQTFMFRLMHAGPNDDLVFQVTQHVTVDANGNIRVSFFDSAVLCK